MSVTLQRLKQAKDAPLIRLFQSGNNLAFTILVLRYERRLKIYLHKLMHNALLEKDVLQSTWIEVIRQFRNHLYKENGKLPQWLYRLAYHKAISALRRQKKFERADDLVAGDKTMELPENPDHPDDRIEQVKQALTFLNIRLRTIVKLKLEEDLTDKEIAERMHTTVGSVTSGYSRAVKKLRKILKKKNKK